MAASKREQILDYIVSALGTALGLTVRRSRSTAIGKAETVAVSLYATSEDVQQHPNQRASRTLSIQVNVFTRGDEPDALADSSVATVVSTLMSNTRCGGLTNTLRETGISWDFDNEVSEDFGVASVTFEIEYTTSAASVAA